MLAAIMLVVIRSNTIQFFKVICIIFVLSTLLKAVYKPAAFFKGILLPLAAAGNCTLLEGTIFASVLARVSIPGNHSAVALLKV